MKMKPLPLYLPTNLLGTLYAELNSTRFSALIMQRHGKLNEELPGPPFALAVCDSTDFWGVAIRANFSATEPEAPLWLKRLKFYVEARLGGHTLGFVTEGIQEEAGGTNASLPFGFPKALKDAFWMPSRRIEADTMELDRLELALPKPGLIDTPRVWLVRDGKLAWIYYMFTGIPESKRHDPTEYDPRNKQKFDEATEEALKKVRENGTFFDSAALLDQMVKDVLKKEYGIEWLTPEDLRLQ